MPLQLAKVRLTRETFGRALTAEGVYDTEVIKASTNTNLLRFFSKPLNQADASGQIAAKNYGETNLEQSAQLPQGNRFELHYINIVFYCNTAGTVASRTDCDKIILGSWFQLQISTITVALMALADIPFGVAPYVPSTTNTNEQNYLLGTSHISDRINTRLGKYNPTIESGESFSGVIQWPANISLANDMRVRVKLGGVYVRPV